MSLKILQAFNIKKNPLEEGLQKYKIDFIFLKQKRKTFLTSACFAYVVTKLYSKESIEEGISKGVIFIPLFRWSGRSLLLAYCILTVERGNCSTFTFFCSCLPELSKAHSQLIK